MSFAILAKQFQPRPLGPKSKALQDFFAGFGGFRDDYDPARQESIAASIFWQIFQHSVEYKNIAQEVGLKPVEINIFRREHAVVPWNNPQANTPAYGLAILDDKYSRADPIVFHVEDMLWKVGTPLKPAWELWHQQKLRELAAISTSDHLLQRLYRLALTHVGPTFADEYVVERRPQILIAHLPEPELMSIPQPPLGIYDPSTQVQIAMVGALVAQDGRRGVTTALHAIATSPTGATLGTVVDVEGTRGVVEDVDSVCDGCFVEVQNMNNISARTTGGPLRGVTPRQWEPVTFESKCRRQGISAVVQAWSPDIPFTYSYNQLKVFTDNQLEPTDSGTALLDGADNILGFGFYRAGVGVVPSYSAWIWADSVFVTLGLVAL